MRMTPKVDVSHNVATASAALGKALDAAFTDDDEDEEADPLGAATH
ncbi:MAG: hypothetical protein NVS3B10_00280 [Polyangiales bacterium]